MRDSLLLKKNIKKISYFWPVWPWSGLKIQRFLMSGHDTAILSFFSLVLLWLPFANSKKPNITISGSKWLKYKNPARLKCCECPASTHRQKWTHLTGHQSTIYTLEGLKKWSTIYNILCLLVYNLQSKSGPNLQSTFWTFAEWDIFYRVTTFV